LVNRNSLNTIENGGSARVLGGEIVSSYSITSGLIVGGNITYSRATLTEDVPGLQARSGQRLPLSPELSAAITTDYTFPLSDCCSTSAGFSYRFVGKRPSGFAGSNVHPQYWLEAYGTLDFRVGFQWKALDLALALKNATDRRGGISADASALQYNPDAPVRVTVIQPRTFGLTLTVRM
jgi:outer membrane receptor protein involved in Fe transport